MIFQFNFSQVKHKPFENTILAVFRRFLSPAANRSKLKVVSTDALMELAGVPNECVSPSTRREDVLKLKGISWE